MRPHAKPIHKPARRITCGAFETRPQAKQFGRQVTRFPRHTLTRGAALIVEQRLSFTVGDEIMKVERRLPAARIGLLGDLLFVACYKQATMRRTPFVKAIQIETLEQMIRDGAASVNIGFDPIGDAL